MKTEEIKNKIDILDVIQKYVVLKRVGNYYSGLCPFHSEKKPSFYVSPEKQIFKCFGCNEGGDVIKFLMKIENLNYHEALQKLKEDYGLEIDLEKKDSLEEKKILEVNYAALKFFKDQLSKNKEAYTYLTARGIKPETITFFEIGFSPGSSFLRDYLFSLGYSLEIIQRAGLVDQKNFDRFQSRIIFPLRDEKGNLLGFMGRMFPDTDKGPKYLNTPETTIFKKSNYLYGLFYSKDYILEEKRVILVEGTIDFIISFQNGLKNIVAISGSALTIEQLKKIKRYCQEISLAFDNDLAGFKTTLKTNMLAKGLGFKVKKLVYNYKDLAEFFEKNQNLGNIKEEIIEDWLWNYLKENYSDSDLVLDIFLSQIKLLPAIKINQYLEKISQEFNIAKKIIEEKLLSAENPIIDFDLETKEKKESISPDIEKKLSFRLLSLFYAQKKYLKEKELKMKTLPSDKNIIEEILSCLDVEFKNLLENIIQKNLDMETEEYLEMAASYYLNFGIDFDKEINKTLKNLKKIKLKKTLENLNQELKTSTKKTEIINKIKNTLLEIKKLEKNA